MKRLSLNKKIAFALIASLIFSTFCASFGFVNEKMVNFLSKAGYTFVNALQLIAVPLVIFALIVGVNGTQDLSQFSRIGGRTMLLYTLTTLFSASLGLLIGNLFRPGIVFNKIATNLGALEGVEAPKMEEGGGAWLPNNLFYLLSDNKNLLSIVCLAIFFGVSLMRITPKKKRFMLMFCSSSHDVFAQMLDYIMQLAPIGLFALVASQVMTIIQENPAAIGNMLIGLGYYTFTVVFGLGILLLVIYPLIVARLSSVSAGNFRKNMRSAQLLGFSTASSTATLPKTSEQVGKMGVSDRVRSFVLSLGATMNMDGTALYQSIATLFITQKYGVNLSLQQQLYVVFYITISVIGVAGVPGASFVTTSMLLKTLSDQDSSIIIAEALALVMIPDRILDMFRTATNITGDAAVAVVVQSAENRRSSASVALED